jgi:CheY-like chemotaxis protein
MSAELFRCWFLLSVILAVQHCAGATRHYFIAAEDASWDYAPSERDLIHGAHIPMPWGHQTQWPKTRFIEYTDSSFSVRKPQPEWLGILGPVIRAEVGDTIVVEFLNRSIRVHNIHPHGLRYDKSGVWLSGGQNMNEQPNPARDARIRVVVADDHPVIRRMVRSVLQQHPHFEVCGEAQNGAEAIEEVKRVRPDAVVLNVTMPLVNGFQAAKEIKKHIPDTAIVILSTHVDKHFVAEARKNGARAYVAKSKIGQALVKP